MIQESVIDRLLALEAATVEKSNPQPNEFLPFRGKSSAYDYDYIVTSLVGAMLQKRLKKKVRAEAFIDSLRDRLAARLTNTTVLEPIIDMYFGSDGRVVDCSPEFLLLQPKEKDRSSEHLATLLCGFVNKSLPAIKFNTSRHFLERLVMECLDDFVEELPEREKNLGARHNSYLPFVEEKFVADLKFLSYQGTYFSENIVSLIRYYNLFYCSQLALNIRNWKNGHPPEVKPLYFIINTEKASMERADLRNCGYDPSLLNPLREVFPRLSMLEYLNASASGDRYPLWMFGQGVIGLDKEIEERIVASVDTFNQSFREENELSDLHGASPNAVTAIERLFNSSIEQFSRGAAARRKDKREYPLKYVKYFEEHVASDFLVLRGRAGKIFTINQDFVLLLTNLCIGPRERVRFQELLSEFRSRGIWFDNYSKQALINFYERVGNVDRMSDSGDAVYVRSTI